MENTLKDTLMCIKIKLTMFLKRFKTRVNYNLELNLVSKLIRKFQKYKIMNRHRIKKLIDWSLIQNLWTVKKVRFAQEAGQTLWRTPWTLSWTPMTKLTKALKSKQAFIHALEKHVLNQIVKMPMTLSRSKILKILFHTKTVTQKPSRVFQLNGTRQSR